MPETLIRPYVDADLAMLVAINDAAYPAVPITSAEEFAALVALSELALVAESEGRPVGFLLAMTPGIDYASENYRWFSARGGEFVYVDRIVLGPDARGLGIGRRLYERVVDTARARGAAEVTCEVNVQPPNPESLAFHARLGFRELAQQATKGGEIVVALLARPV